jgi:LmbE family N-acetylglucosaminyl deacetylase
MLGTQAIESALVIAPHGDDVALGAGALIAQASKEGIAVHVLFFATDASPHYGLGRETTLDERLEEMSASAKILGFTYDVVYAGEGKLERLDSLPLRDLVDVVERTVDARAPDLVAVPHGDDYDQDHVACFRAAHAALRPMPAATGKRFVGKVVSYEMPKLEWATIPFRPSLYVSADRELIDRKCEAVAAYTTQTRADPHIRSLANLRRLAGLRGAEAGIDFAEAYHVWRWVV